MLHTIRIKKMTSKIFLTIINRRYRLGKNNKRVYLCEDKKIQCNNRIINNKRCIKHGARKRFCTIIGCSNTVVTNGVCKSHGSKRYRYNCIINGCPNKVQNNGLCCIHGCRKYICKIDGCTTQVQNNNLCCTHGADQTQSNKRRRERYCTDINYKIKTNLRSRLSLALKAVKAEKTSRTMKLLGCNIEFFKTHIENQVVEGMTWENHGFGRDNWHLDHIKACSNFNLTNPEEQKICFHYTNLQPLWQFDNLSKSNKKDYIYPDIYKIINKK